MGFLIPLEPHEFARYLNDARTLYNQLPPEFQEDIRGDMPPEYVVGGTVAWSRISREYRDAGLRKRRDVLNNIATLGQAIDVTLMHLVGPEGRRTKEQVYELISIRFLLSTGTDEQLENRQRVRLVEAAEAQAKARHRKESTS